MCCSVPTHKLVVLSRTFGSPCIETGTPRSGASGAGRPVTVCFPVRMVTIAAVVGLTPCILVSRKGMFLPTFSPVNQASSPRQPSSWPEEEMASGAGTDLVRVQATFRHQPGAFHPTLLFWITCQWN